jgi:hypothetical protein
VQKVTDGMEVRPLMRTQPATAPAGQSAVPPAAPAQGN